MTSFEIQEYPFDTDAISVAAGTDNRLSNWPIVYTLDDTKRVYVGESLSATGRMRQHASSESKRGLTRARIIVDNTFNKSACLDLESTLIGWFSGDGKYQVLNRNTGITRADYYDRASYEKRFREIFDELRTDGLFKHSIDEIHNLDMFKLSPFKALTQDQEIAVQGILEGLSHDIQLDVSSTAVVQGDPGTGKTIVAIYLIKLLEDISVSDPDEVVEDSDMFSEFFIGENRQALENLRIGFVIPQQSLRETVKRVFKKVPNLSSVEVMTPFTAADRAVEISPESNGEGAFDLLVVDESHRLSHRANQPSGVQNKNFREINERLFGADDLAFTQLDWMKHCSSHQIFMVDGEQSVRPADLPSQIVGKLIQDARGNHSFHHLMSQMRVSAGNDYIRYIHDVLSDEPPAKPLNFGSNYELRFFDSFAEMFSEIKRRDSEYGLSRLVAGYAWKWVSKKHPGQFDINIDGVELNWNSTAKDWINSATSLNEVGSIHTVQGYDLNYAGVIVGRDLQFDTQSGKLKYSARDYFDVKGRESNKQLGITYSDDDILQYIRNIYRVLMTRGVRGTFVYVCDPALREHLRKYFEFASVGTDSYPTR